MARVSIGDHDRRAFQQQIGKLCNAGMRFVKCPVELDLVARIHNARLPKDYVEAIATVNKYGKTVYQTSRHSIEHVLEMGDGRAMWLRMVAYDYKDGPFMEWPDQCWDGFPDLLANIHSDRICGRSEHKHQVVPAGLFENAMAPEQWEQLVQWGLDCVQMELDVDMVMTVFNEIIGIPNTIGQLYRMVPELAQYGHAALRIAHTNAKAQSRLPVGWAEYDKTKVQRLLELLAKLHLLHSINPHEENGQPQINQGNYSWCHVMEHSPKT